MDEGVIKTPFRIRLWMVACGSGVLALVVMSSYLILTFGDLYLPKNPLAKDFTLLYLTSGTDGTITWYDYKDGMPVKHPAPGQGTLTGLARAKGEMYFSFVSNEAKPNSTIYKYNGSTYEKVYVESGKAIQGITVSADAGLIGFTESSSTEYWSEVVDVPSGIKTPLAKSLFAPQFLMLNGTKAVMYASGPDLYLRTYKQGGGWSSPETLYKGLTRASVNSFATDGAQHYAFVDPVNHTVQEWNVTSLVPLITNPIKIHPPVTTFSIAYGGGKLYGYQYEFKLGLPTYQHLTVSEAFLGGETHEYRAPKSFGNNGKVFLFSKQQ